MSYINFFEEVDDYRVTGRCFHFLGDILMLSLCAFLSGADDFEEVEDYGIEKIDFLSTFLYLPHGIPSHDTINRVFEHICPLQFSSCLRNHSLRILEFIGRKQINIDGKILRGTRTSERKNSGLCIVSAWASEHHLTLGQVLVDKKSNEKTVIPSLLEELDLNNAIVTIDAMATHQNIADLIIAGGGDYILALKKNQKNLFEEVESEFLRQRDSLVADKTIDFGSGRIETRTAYVVENIEFIDQLAEWESVKSILVVESKREKNEIVQEHRRFYICSFVPTPEQANQYVRAHWGIEGTLHWHLDVSFGEDKSKTKKGNAPENLNILRKIALQALKQTEGKQSIKNKRKMAGWNNEYLLKILETFKIRCD